MDMNMFEIDEVRYVLYKSIMAVILILLVLLDFPRRVDTVRIIQNRGAYFGMLKMIKGFSICLVILIGLFLVFIVLIFILSQFDLLTRIISLLKPISSVLLLVTITLIVIFSIIIDKKNRGNRNRKSII